MPTKALRWPMLGVVRRDVLRTAPGTRGPWPAAWAVNCRVQDNIDRRLRGGSRPGLTKYVADDMGTTIADIASIDVSSAASGASEVLFVLVDSAVKTVEGGTTTTQVAYLTTSTGDIVTDTSGNQITVGTGSAPSSGFLVTGQQMVFAVTTSGITKMDPKTGQTDTLVTSGGTIPTSCTFGAVYRDRMCLSGADNTVYMSRQGDYTDWDTGVHVENRGRPVPFQLALGADIGPLPTAMIAHKDATMLVASSQSLWLLSGDPAADGSLRRVSENVGIIGDRAWCKVEDTVFFLATDGVYHVGADGSGLTPLSEVTVPEELRDVDTSTTTVSMGLDYDRLAFHVFLRTSGGSDTHWAYELQTESWWPVRLPDDQSPLATCQHAGELLLAGNDGYIRKVSGDDDDGTAISSHVAIGPVRMGHEQGFGRLLRLYGMTAAGSADVTWRLIVGNTAEEAADNSKLCIEALQAGTSTESYVHSSGTWEAGINRRAYPRARGQWMSILLSASGQWAFEGCQAETVHSGKWRG